MKQLSVVICLLLGCSPASAQYAWQYGEDREPSDLGAGIRYSVEAQGSLADGKTPLWLNANKYGVSSLEARNGYLRGSVIRSIDNDSARHWGVGYGADVVVPVNYTSSVIVQQAFVEARWLHGVIGVGAKEYPMEMKNARLSSGAQTLGINARPVPQVRLSMPKYWTIPALGRWVSIKGHVAYGKTTDDNWQRDFTRAQSKYTEDVLFHSKAAYMRIGSEDRFCPWSLELGVESATMFGGKSHIPDGNGQMVTVRNRQGLSSFLKALVPGGGDVPEDGTIYQNEEGNILGSWLMRLNYDAENWRVGVYADKYFEDHSSMFMVDYDGYGEGEEWNEKKKTRFFLYDFKDIMLGVELNLKYGRWLRDVVVEYVSTKYQSGPVYHDHSPGRSDHVSGRDNYYNHYIFSGWQHWGQALGNPLYRSPIYNKSGMVRFENNRFKAWHVGFDGRPTDKLGYRVLATCQTGWGTYDDPLLNKEHDVSLLVESTYQLPREWTLTGALGMDFGKILGNNVGFQLTITKSGIFNL